MILIKFASRGRKDWFIKGIRNIRQTMYSQDYMILVSADIDDPAMCNDDVFNFCNEDERIILIHGKSESKVHAINRDMDFVKDYPWRILINFSDDMKFISDNWDKTLLESVYKKFGESLDFVAHFDDGYAGESLMTMSIIGREYYERDNYIYHPAYKSFSCDAEAMYVAMARGRHAYFPDKIFVHQHPANTPMPNDDTYVRNSLATPHDIAVYWDRLHRDFEVDVPGPYAWDKFKKR